MLSALVLSIGIVPFLPAEPASAVPTLVNFAGNQNASANNVSATLPAAATIGNLIVVICTHAGNVTFTTPVGFSAAISQAGSSTIPSQAIYYKTAVGGESTIQCAFGGTGKVSIQIAQFNGIYRAPYPSIGFATSGTQTYSSGTTAVSNYSDALLVTGFMVPVGATFSNTWTNSFSTIQSGGILSGPQNNRMMWASSFATVSSAGNYSTATTYSGGTANTRGQIVAFRAIVPNPINSISLINGVGAPAPSLISMPSVSTSFACQTVSTSLFNSSRKIRFVQTTNTPAPGPQTISMTVAPNWTGITPYSTANPAGAGCTGGQATITNVLPTIQKVSGPCAVPSSPNATANKALDNTVGGGTEFLVLQQNLEPGCVWDIYGFDLSQKIPPERRPGSYTMKIDLTVVSS